LPVKSQEYCCRPARYNTRRPAPSVLLGEPFKNAQQKFKEISRAAHPEGMRASCWPQANKKRGVK